MAGKLAIKTIQLGDSATPSQNFVVTLPAVPDGTLKISRGNDGATTQDVLTVNADGTITVNQGITNVGSLPAFQCRAWVNFDGTRNAAGGSDSANTNRFIRASGNVTSVLRNGTGNYTVTFTVPMPDVNYGATASARQAANGYFTSLEVGPSSALRTASAITVNCTTLQSISGDNRVGSDNAEITLAVFK